MVLMYVANLKLAIMEILITRNMMNVEINERDLRLLH